MISDKKKKAFQNCSIMYNLRTLSVLKIWQDRSTAMLRVCGDKMTKAG